MCCDAHDPDGPDREHRQGEQVVTAVDLEAVGSVRHKPGGRDDVARGVLYADDVGHVCGLVRAWSR